MKNLNEMTIKEILNLMSKNFCVSYALKCALSVIDIYENKYPNEKAPRKAIEAAEDYLEGKLNKNAASSAAYAAYAANAASSSATYAAANAAYAAYADAHVASYAASYAAADASYAAASENKKIDYKEILLGMINELTLLEKIILDLED